MLDSRATLVEFRLLNKAVDLLALKVRANSIASKRLSPLNARSVSQSLFRNIREFHRDMIVNVLALSKWKSFLALSITSSL